MNVKRFTARTPREALALVRQAFGQDAVVLSTKPCEGGVEVLAMAPDGVQQIERAGASAPVVTQPALPPAPAARRAAVPAERVEPRLDDGVAQDVEQLAMSTLSFQDYVRERMLKRRQAAIDASTPAPAAAPPREPGREPVRLVARRESAGTPAPARRPHEDIVAPPRREAEPRPMPSLGDPAPFAASPRHEAAEAAQPLRREQAEFAAPTRREHHDVASASRRDHHEPASTARRDLNDLASTSRREVPTLREEVRAAAAPSFDAAAAIRREQSEMMSELRSMRGLIEQRFGALAFMEKLQRQPRQATLTQRLLDHGYSPSLIRKLAESLPAEVDEMAWAAGVLERNLGTGEHEPALEDLGGVYALIGATGVGKTTSTAKLAAAFAARHGAGNLGLITLDAYRVAAHEQLRTYGRILGVPVHTAHDRASLEDLLDLLAGKKMVLIDTAGMAQRDSRTRELLDMLSHRAVNRLLVINASAQGDTIEDVLHAYGAAACRGVVLSKVDEAVKLGPALDALVRHKLKVLAVGNGQRVPEDWHRLSAQALVQQSLRGGTHPAWRFDAGDVSLVFAGPPSSAAGAPLHA